MARESTMWETFNILYGMRDSMTIVSQQETTTEISTRGLALPKQLPVIFTVTTVGRDKDGGTRSRCVGWFETLEDAEEIIKGNYGYLDEHNYYQWVVIEKMEAGLYPSEYCDEQRWYRFVKKDPSVTERRWDNITAELIECPEEFKQTLGWSIG